MKIGIPKLGEVRFTPEHSCSPEERARRVNTLLLFVPIFLKIKQD